jgi:hypothetical protein
MEEVRTSETSISIIVRTNTLHICLLFPSAEKEMKRLVTVQHNYQETQRNSLHTGSFCTEGHHLVPLLEPALIRITTEQGVTQGEWRGLNWAPPTYKPLAPHLPDCHNSGHSPLKARHFRDWILPVPPGGTY